MQVDDTSALWDFDIVDGMGAGTVTSANDLFLVAHALNINDLANTQNNRNTAAVLQAVQATLDPELAGVVANMNGAPTNAALNAVLEAAQPQIDGADVGAVQGLSARLMNLSEARMDELRALESDLPLPGFALTASAAQQQAMAGPQAWVVSLGDGGDQDGIAGLGAPAQSWQGVFGNRARQNERDGIAGYTALTGGVAAGFDTGDLLKKYTLGAVVSYAQSDIESDNANRAQTRVDGVQVVAYATARLPGRSYLDLMGAYSRSGNSTWRHDVGGTPGLTARGDFESEGYGLRARFGKAIAWEDFGLTVSPFAGVDWQHYSADSYQETGAGGAGINVTAKDLDSLEAGAGIKAARKITTATGGTWMPEAHAAYYREMIGDPMEKTVSFIGGGPSFLVASPDPARDRISLGAALTYYGTSYWDYSLAYNLDLKQDFSSHALLGKIALKF